MNKKRIIYFILTLIMAVVILMFSSQSSEDSNNLSYKIDIKIFELITQKTESTSAEAVKEESQNKINKTQNTASENTTKETSNKTNQNKKEKTQYPIKDKRFHDIDVAVRKTAHVTLYMIFAIFLTLFINTYKLKNWKNILIVLFIGFLYACIDEYNQKLGGTRTGIFTDTLIDTAGCFLGINIIMIYKKIIRKKVESNNESI